MDGTNLFGGACQSSLYNAPSYEIRVPPPLIGRGPQRAATDPSPDWPRPLYGRIKNEENTSAKPVPPSGALWCTQNFTKTKSTISLQIL